MNGCDRREFLGRIGSSMIASVLTSAWGSELNLAGILAADGNGRLDFGPLESLAVAMQESSADALMRQLRLEMDRGTELRTLVAAAALANARAFGGQDYIGYHCFMAQVPALSMSRRLDGPRAALPVFKVLHRNARRIQASAGRGGDALQPVEPADLPAEPSSSLLAAGRHGEFDAAERTLAGLLRKGPQPAYAALQPLVRDNIDVHQVVLAYRSWDVIGLVGEENAPVMLRQVMRQCIDRDENRRRDGRPTPSIRALLPELLEAHGLDREIAETRRLPAAQIEDLAAEIFASERDDAAERVARLLATGVARDDVGEALSLAAVRLLLHDPGTTRASAGKPVGSVHGASVGLHAADSANAWRGIAAATEAPNAVACLVTGAWHTAGQSGRMDRSAPQHAAEREAVRSVPADDLLAALGEALRGRDQGRACALVERYGTLRRDPEVLISVLVEPAVLHDGALHHEKYFHTATQEFARGRPEMRWDHLVSLARVLASGYGFEDEGIGPAREALGV